MKIETKMLDCFNPSSKKNQCYYDFEKHRYICKCGLYEDNGFQLIRKVKR